MEKVINPTHPFPPLDEKPERRPGRSAQIELEAAAGRAYSAFVANAKEYLPPGIPVSWSSLPNVVRRSWIAAATAARKNDAA